MISSPKLFKLLIKQDFYSFLYKVFKTVNPGGKFTPNWHLELLADHLSEVSKGNIKRLIINVPPRSLKSVMISVAWPAWLLGHNPTTRVIAASYSQALSIKHSLDARLVLESVWYKALFPNTSLSKKHNQKSKFLTTEQGFRFATSVGGSLTGEGGDVLLIDDPHNPTYIHSKKAREKVMNWYEQTFATRLNDPEKGVIVIVMQRLHPEDLCGYLLNSGNKQWHVLKLPAIADEDYHWQINNHRYHYLTKSFLQPSRQSEDILLKISQEIGTTNFAAQYMQSPIQQVGLLNMEQINYYDTLTDFEFIVQSWDTATKLSDRADYSVCSVWGVEKGKYYLLAIIRDKFSYPELKEQAIKVITKWQPKIILIEDHNSGQSLIQDLKLVNRIHNIIPQRPKIDKITRFASVTGLFDSVFFPRKAPWLTAALKELTDFPHGKNDDVVDSVSQFLNYIKTYKPSTMQIRAL